MHSGADYYQTLGVAPGASFDQIRTAYRRRARQCHPDMGGTQEQMIELITAWEVLSSPERRALYDRARSTAAQDSAAHRAWASVEQEAHRSASTAARIHAVSWDDFCRWADQTAAKVQRGRAGRAAAGAMAGGLLGAALGGVAGPFVGVAIIAGLGIGATAGAIGGLLAILRSAPAVTAGNPTS